MTKLPGAGTRALAVVAVAAGSFGSLGCVDSESAVPEGGMDAGPTRGGDDGPARVTDEASVGPLSGPWSGRLARLHPRSTAT